MTKKVMVLMGGFSSEREVSLQSGKSIAAGILGGDTGRAILSALEDMVKYHSLESHSEGFKKQQTRR